MGTYYYDGLIEESKKTFYYQGLKRWEEDATVLLETCCDGQDTKCDLLSLLGINA